MNLPLERPPIVDVLMLCRPGERPRQQVLQALAAQQGVIVRHHIATGWPANSDQNRWQTIARARNLIKRRARAPWVMFVDDDVVLGPRCLITLVNALKFMPELGAVAADYDNDLGDKNRRGHIGMGACMFRGQVLSQLEFRSTQSQCECLCCCEDLRRAGIGIEYHALAEARHLRNSASSATSGSVLDSSSARILAAFDRRDVARFENQFLRSLRAWGNRETVIAVTYGLYPSQIQRLRSLPGVQVVALPNNGVMVPVRRLKDFAHVTRALPPNTPTAYWDVSDVIFQTALGSLWSEVARWPDRLLAVAEPKGYPDNGVILPWSLSIKSPRHRMSALRLLAAHPFLNSGFAAGTAETMSQYFTTAQQLRDGPELCGTTDWGDQMCLNIYCHSSPERWRRLDEAWNYCVHDRQHGEVYVTSQGIIASRRRGLIPIAHGNARSLRQFALSML